MARLFHEVRSDSLEDICLHGLKRGQTGDKRDDAIAVTDRFLNDQIPKSLQDKGVDRLKNIFCYLPGDDDDVVDVSTGKTKPPDKASPSNQQTLLEIDVDPMLCFVSDLDLYDTIKETLQAGNESDARRLAQSYWQSLTPLPEYQGNFARPEVMVISDISPTAIINKY